MELLFEKTVSGRQTSYIPELEVPFYQYEGKYLNEQSLDFPELSELDVSRHYSELERRTFGINQGFYPLGSCTMKYNPRFHEQVASLPGFCDIHPLQSLESVPGAKFIYEKSEELLCKITGMDYMSFQPAAGAQGEFLGILLIKKFHEKKGEGGMRSKILIPDSAHGTNPATAALCGLNVVSVRSTAEGYMDLDHLRELANTEIAGLMLTNPNTLGVFDPNICEITKIVHEAGGLCYYDGANLNPIMNIARPGDMGFDCIHLNLHKTFSTPHGGGGPGAGAVGMKKLLKECYDEVWKVKAFHGHFLVVVRALCYLLTLGEKGIRDSAVQSVLSANYMKKQLEDTFTIKQKGFCMHEFVITLEEEAKNYGFRALDVAKAFIDYQMYPPTMYFPQIIPEALMVEPTETESKETLDYAVEIYKKVYQDLKRDPDSAKDYPKTTPIHRPDEVSAARNPKLRWRKDK